MSYNAFKVMHLLGVIMFLGNIIVTASGRQWRTKQMSRTSSTRARHGSSRIFGAWHNNVTC
jgi:hypothetical protein